jgi:hypothetical protein
MPEIYFNQVPQQLAPMPATWGELLDMLDERAAGDGTILSAARFDGVEEPAFRDPDVVARTLSGVSRVEVESATPNAFLRSCLTDVIGPLEASADTVLTLAGLYRGHDLTRGHQGLTQLASDLRNLATLVAMLGGPIGIDLTAAGGDGVTADQQIEELESALDALVSAQAAEDWLTVADILEYDLEPLIRRWAAVLARINTQLQ